MNKLLLSLAALSLLAACEAGAPPAGSKAPEAGAAPAGASESTESRSSPGRVCHIRYRLKPGSGIGAFSAALMPSASTRRVSSGSITPSSHSRAVEW